MRGRKIAIAIFGLWIAFYIYCYPPLRWIQTSSSTFPLSQKWSRYLDGPVRAISATAEGEILFARTKNSIYALRSEDGKAIWRFGISPQVYDTPALAFNQMVYVSDSKSIRALDQGSARIVWYQELPDSGGRLVDVSNDFVVVNNVGVDVRIYDAITGDLLWNRGVGRGFVQAYIDGDFIYVADHGISAYDARTGNPVWQIGQDIIDSSSYRDGIIYYESGPLMAAFNSRNQSELWRLSWSTPGFDDPVAGMGLLFATDLDHLFAFRKSDGDRQWMRVINRPMRPTLLGKNVFVMEQFNRVIYAYDASSGEASGTMRVSFPIFLDVNHQDLFATHDSLFFARGRQLFALGQ